IQELIVEKIAALQVKSLPDLLQSSSVIGSAIQQTETTSVKSLCSMATLCILDSLFGFHLNFHCVVLNFSSKLGAEPPFVFSLIEKEKKRLWLNRVKPLRSPKPELNWSILSFLLKLGKTLVMESFRIINIIADAVLAMKVADEKVTRIKTIELSMTLGRHTPTKLVGLSIEGGDGRFVLPDEKETFDSSTGNTAFVDSQVSFHKSSSF
ncbi:unnamed protein product, partial [Porites evermanni]